MRQSTVEQNDQNFKVAPVISDEKLQLFKDRVFSTIIGLSTYAHYEYHDKTQQQRIKIKILSLVTYFLLPILIVVPNSVISTWSLHALAVIIPAVLCPLTSLIVDIILSRSKPPHKYIFLSIYSYLWAVHFFISRQLLLENYYDSNLYVCVLILSIISVITSASTIGFAPVRQFSASTFTYQQFHVHSTLYVRFYAIAPILLTQLGLYYSPLATLGHPALYSLQLIAAFSFLLWLLGLISSLYNNVFFIVNNLVNCLIFGEQVLHSGNNYRGQHIWWVPFVAFALNIASIGANVAFVFTFKLNGQVQPKIVQGQHIILVCLAAFTSLITSFVVYCSYRCADNKKPLIRLNKFNLTQAASQQVQTGQYKKKRQVYQGKFFLNHKQVLMTLTTAVVPLIVCLLGVIAFYQFYGAYGLGQTYDQPTNFKAQKLTTWILLLVNVSLYLIFVIFKQITRVRSKFGCSINPGVFKQFFAEVERDFFMKMILKVTGALAVMGLVLRIQNLQVFSWKILGRTPISAEPHPYLTFFISYIFIPILIYRSYKRSQTFSHCFHITILVSFILTVIDSTLYYYQSIFVVLAMPNFPENPFRLLLISPFTTPKKLVHKSQNKYRIAYLLVNSITFLIYICTLGTLQFTMIFGLPMYWCVIPSINCQSVKKKPQKDLKLAINDFETTNQNFKPEPQINSTTPQHNLYQKIVSEIPFYIFRNKRPGYYLLRISKYILLVQVIADFYGIFQVVSFVGLETQEVTTCHAKEGETIDRISEHTWSDNDQNLEQCACSDALKTVIHEQHCVTNVKITSQNDIQLTGIVQSQQFYQTFKKCLIKSLVFQYNKLLQNNPKNQLTSQQSKQAEILLEDLYIRVSKQKIDEIFPYKFIEQNNFIFNAKFKQLSSNKVGTKKKLPPIGKQDKMKKQKIIDDFADLIRASNTSQILKVEDNKKQTIDIDKMNEQAIPKDNSADDKIQKSHLHMAVIMSAYLAVLGKINYLNTERVYKMLKKDGSALSQFEFKGGNDLVANSVGCAFKIAINKQLEAEQKIQFDDFISYDKNQYLGTLQSSGFSEAITAQKQDIWTASYNQSKKILSIKRLARNSIPLYMFSFETHAVQAVWNNLRFELVFATNDNDQRYSIQTHEYLLRNLLVEGCQQPYGYAGYYSEQFINL